MERRRRRKGWGFLFYGFKESKSGEELEETWKLRFRILNLKEKEIEGRRQRSINHLENCFLFCFVTQVYISQPWQLGFGQFYEKKKKSTRPSLFGKTF